MDATALDRRSFLVTLTLVPAAVVTGVSRRPATAREVDLGSFHVAGYRFHDGPSIESRLRPGTLLDATREPKNPADPNAIRLRLGQATVGYVPRARNSGPAQMMDAGLGVRFRVVEVRPAAPAWERVLVAASLRA